MDLLELARRDIKAFTQRDFADTLIFKPNEAAAGTTVKGLVTKHHMSIDPDTGLPVNSKNIHCTVVESVLIDAGYTVRNANNEVNLINQLVVYTDSAGIERTYQIDQAMPDETLGNIVMILGDYE